MTTTASAASQAVDVLEEPVDAGHAAVGGQDGPKPERRQRGRAFLRHHEIGRTGRETSTRSTRSPAPLQTTVEP